MSWINIYETFFLECFHSWIPVSFYRPHHLGVPFDVLWTICKYTNLLETNNFQLICFGRQNASLFRNFYIESYLFKSFINNHNVRHSSQYQIITSQSKKTQQQSQSQAIGMARARFQPKSIKQARSEFEDNIKDLIDFTPIIIHETNLDFVETLVDCAQCFYLSQKLYKLRNLFRCCVTADFLNSTDQDIRNSVYKFLEQLINNNDNDDNDNDDGLQLQYSTNNIKYCIKLIHSRDDYYYVSQRKSKLTLNLCYLSNNYSSKRKNNDKNGEDTVTCWNSNSSAYGNKINYDMSGDVESPLATIDKRLGDYDSNYSNIHLYLMNNNYDIMMSFLDDGPNRHSNSRSNTNHRRISSIATAHIGLVLKQGIRTKSNSMDQFCQYWKFSISSYTSRFYRKIRKRYYIDQINLTESNIHSNIERDLNLVLSDKERSVFGRKWTQNQLSVPCMYIKPLNNSISDSINNFLINYNIVHNPNSHSNGMKLWFDFGNYNERVEAYCNQTFGSVKDKLSTVGDSSWKKNKIINIIDIKHNSEHENGVFVPLVYNEHKSNESNGAGTNKNDNVNYNLCKKNLLYDKDSLNDAQWVIGHCYMKQTSYNDKIKSNDSPINKEKEIRQEEKNETGINTSKKSKCSKIKKHHGRSRHWILFDSNCEFSSFETFNQLKLRRSMGCVINNHTKMIYILVKCGNKNRNNKYCILECKIMINKKYRILGLNIKYLQTIKIPKYSMVYKIGGYCLSYSKKFEFYIFYEGMRNNNNNKIKSNGIVKWQLCNKYSNVKGKGKHLRRFVKIYGKKYIKETSSEFDYFQHWASQRRQKSTQYTRRGDCFSNVQLI